MAIREDGVTAVSVGELLCQHLRIPHYQRPYSWEPDTALQLLVDVREAFNDPGRNGAPYVLGAVILHQDGDRLDVVDGQQRLLTLRMIVAILDPDERYAFPPGGNNPVSRVWTGPQRSLSALDGGQLELLSFVRDRCQLVRVVTDDVDEAFRVFDSQNYRGKPLAPHDLLKAHHLREMRGETEAMQAAVVETWESVKDEDLDRLFSIYLYRIARWSDGESAPGFTTHDIGMFKGISPQSVLSPSARYHLAAQTALPMLNSWGAPNSLGAREAGRSRFQLDAPLMAGQCFFEMVEFMLRELKHLAEDAFGDDVKDYSVYDPDALVEANVLDERPSKSRYRYVSELYLAVLLYYTNKFGDHQLPEARAQLFAWAYALRVARLRVQFRSIDNRAARGDESSGSAFTLLRNAPSGLVINQLRTSVTPYNDSHEEELFALLGSRGAK